MYVHDVVKAPKKCLFPVLPDQPCLKPSNPNWFIDTMREEKRKKYFRFMWFNFKSNWQIQDMSDLQGKYISKFDV